MSPSGHAAPALGRASDAPRHLTLVPPGTAAGGPPRRAPGRVGAALLVLALGTLNVAAVVLTVLASPAR